MNTKLFVGNLPFGLSEPAVQELFAQCGKVISVVIPTDRDTGRKRGFAFVEMENQADAEAAVKQLNGSTIEGRQIVVNAAHERGQRAGAGASGGGGGGGRRW